MKSSIGEKLLLIFLLVFFLAYAILPFAIMFALLP